MALPDFDASRLSDLFDDEAEPEPQPRRLGRPPGWLEQVTAFGVRRGVLRGQVIVTLQWEDGGAELSLWGYQAESLLGQLDDALEGR